VRLDVKNLRVDIVIAVCALTISTLACAASILQTRVIADQLSAAVWPYVDVTTNVVMAPHDNEWSVTLSNDGLGPAVLRSVVLTVDGKPLKSIDAAAWALAGVAPHSIPGATRAAEIQGSVLRPGADLVLVDARGPRLGLLAARGARRVGLQVCYCSILERCWVRMSPDPGPPRDVSRCPT
jgi:hypothetical protein